MEREILELIRHQEQLMARQNAILAKYKLPSPRTTTTSKSKPTAHNKHDKSSQHVPFLPSTSILVSLATHILVFVQSRQPSNCPCAGNAQYRASSSIFHQPFYGYQRHPQQIGGRVSAGPARWYRQSPPHIVNRNAVVDPRVSSIVKCRLTALNRLQKCRQRTRANKMHLISSLDRESLHKNVFMFQYHRSVDVVSGIHRPSNPLMSHPRSQPQGLPQPS